MTATDTAAPATSRVFRVEVRPTPGQADHTADATLAAARATLGQKITALQTATLFLIEADLDETQAQQIADELLGDPVNQAATLGTTPPADGVSVIEVHYLPGVMDPVAESTQDAIREMLPGLNRVAVRTGVRYDLTCAERVPAEALTRFASSQLANTVVQAIHLEPYHP